MGLFDCDCDCAAPPNFSAVANANAEAARLAKQAADAELAFRKQVFAESRPSAERLRALAEQIAQQQLGISQRQNETAQRSTDRFFHEFAPVERQVILDALGFGNLSPDQQSAVLAQLTPPEELARQQAIAGAIQSAVEAAAKRAQDTAAQSSAQARQQALRSAARRGLDPTRLNAFNADLARATALAQATAANQARERVISQGATLRSGVANLGRGLPNTAAQALGVALNSGNSATANQGAASQALLTPAKFVPPGFESQINAANLQQHGALGLGGLQANVFGTQAAQFANMGGANPLGEILGTGLGFALTRL